MRLPADGLGNYRAGKETQGLNPPPFPNLPAASLSRAPRLLLPWGLARALPFLHPSRQGHFRSEILLSHAHRPRKAGHLPLPPCHPAAHLRRDLHALAGGPCVLLSAPGSQLAEE